MLMVDSSFNHLELDLILCMYPIVCYMHIHEKTDEVIQIYILYLFSSFFAGKNLNEQTDTNRHMPKS